VHGGGHGWPGGNIEKYANGNLNMDISANYEILKFFSEAQLTPASVESSDIEEPFSTYPNPTENHLSIETPYRDNYSVSITSLNGQLVFTGEMEGTFHQLDISSFQKGIYFITISSKEFISTRKIIKL
jgi:hypothetical protein